jgi:hypothetical protein
VAVTNTSHDENVDVASSCHTWVKVHRFERKLIPKNDRGERAVYALRRRMVNARWWKGWWQVVVRWLLGQKTSEGGWTA